MHASGEGEDSQQETKNCLGNLSDEEHSATRLGVGDKAADGRQDEDRDLTGEGDQAK